MIQVNSQVMMITTRWSMSIAQIPGVMPPNRMITTRWWSKSIAAVGLGVIMITTRWSKSIAESWWSQLDDPSQWPMTRMITTRWSKSIAHSSWSHWTRWSKSIAQIPGVMTRMVTTRWSKSMAESCWLQLDDPSQWPMTRIFTTRQSNSESIAWAQSSCS
jgi:hypothetical protein